MADESENENAEQPEAEEAQAEEQTPTEEPQAVEETPAPEEPQAAEEAPASEEPPAAEEEQAEEPQAADEAPPADEPQTDEPQASEEPAAEEAPAATDAEAPAEAPASAPEPSPSVSGDLPPGADLDPIALEQPQRDLSAEERARLEAEAEERAQREAAMDDDEVVATSRTPAEIRGDGRYLATGKRKSAIARVTVSSGSGDFQVNGRTLDEYFPRAFHRTMARQPLAAAGYEDNVDVRVRVHGGGIGGQAAAVRHGIARALTEIDPELRGDLKRRGFLTRDPRVKERRKAGLKKARKRPQFSKR